MRNGFLPTTLAALCFLLVPLTPEAEQTTVYSANIQVELDGVKSQPISILANSGSNTIVSTMDPVDPSGAVRLSSRTQSLEDDSKSATFQYNLERRFGEKWHSIGDGSLTVELEKAATIRWQSFNSNSYLAGMYEITVLLTEREVKSADMNETDCIADEVLDSSLMPAFDKDCCGVKLPGCWYQCCGAIRCCACGSYCCEPK
jgi:hypothetical protein